jgi:hypothetical protein
MIRNNYQNDIKINIDIENNINDIENENENEKDKIKIFTNLNTQKNINLNEEEEINKNKIILHNYSNSISFKQIAKINEEIVIEILDSINGDYENKENYNKKNKIENLTSYDNNLYNYKKDLENNKENCYVVNDIGINPIQIEVKEKENFLPLRIKRTFYLTLATMIFALILIIIGIGYNSTGYYYRIGIILWCMSLFLFIPGFYFSMLFIKAYRTKNFDERERIFEKIPKI